MTLAIRRARRARGQLFGARGKVVIFVAALACLAFILFAWSRP